MITAIMIDNREPEYFQHLKFAGVPTMVTLLECGDVQAVTDDGCTLVFERKTPSDFLNSLRDDRLFPQLARMTEIRNANHRMDEPMTYWPYLVITGQFLPNGNGKVTADGRETGWSYASVMGTLLSIQEMGIFVVFANGDLDYEETILRIGKRDRKPKMRILPARPAQILGPKAAFLSSLPGIGIEKMQEILDWSGNNVAHALIGLTDMEIKSPVGLALRRRLRDVLGLQEGENLEIVGTQITEPIMKGQ
jgi:ERCC4-type nuclease